MDSIEAIDVRESPQKTDAPRILHLSSFDAESGAARGSVWLTEALRHRGVESAMVVGRKRGDDPEISPLPGTVAPVASVLRMKLDQLPLARYRRTAESFWTVGWVPWHTDRLMRDFAPDIVHLHWVGAGFVPIQALKQFGCPVVWTMRDMWSFTGGCHYTAGCRRYEEACGACPQLRSDDEGDLSRAVWKRKRKHWQGVDLWLVAISDWLADCTRSSSLLSSFPVEVIPNGLDLSRFQPADKETARLAWNFPLDREILVYGAMHATQDPRKGYRELVEAIDRLKAAGRADKLMLAVFGAPKGTELPSLGIEGRNVGYLDDDRQLSLLYAAADVAVVPSIQEAFGKTVIEAMACGTPVVAFDSGGPKNIIDHRHDGYLADSYSTDDLAAGITWCLGQVKAGVDLGRRARAKVKAKFDIDVVAASYERLYRRILARAHNRIGAA
jgi:glycosyltransferase involved in cell wall biosynthesis